MRIYAVRIFQRNGRPGWYGRYWLNGKYLIEKFGDTKPEAELKQADIYLQLNNRTLPAHKRAQQWDNLVAKYIIHLEGNKRRIKTVRDSQNVLNMFRDICGPLLTTQITQQSIDKFKTARHKTVKSISVNHDLRVIRAFLNWAYELGFITRKIKINMLSVQQTDPFTLPEKSVHALILAAESLNYPDMKLFIQIAIATGLRRSDIQKLSESDFDRQNKLLTVTLRKTGIIVKIPISSELIRAIDNYVFHFVPKDWQLIFHPVQLPDEIDYPFPDKKWNEIRTKAGFGRVDNEWGTDFKALRATAFTNMAEQGVPVEVVQKIAGHKSISTTMRFYMHIRESRLLKAGKIPNAKTWFIEQT